ncbi:MAG: glycosyltransferase family 4 protein [Opitutaceae bacterium]
MRIAHLLRKYNPAEWGGTETVITQLTDGLRRQGVGSIVYSPRIAMDDTPDPLAAAGCAVRRFDACVPIWGISPEFRRQMIAVGGNLMSFDLIRALWSTPCSAIHSHTLGRIGGIGLTIARQKKIPFVVTIHGGVYDLPAAMRRDFNAPRERGWEWGKLFGVLLKSRRLLQEADAIITCNEREAALIRKQHPDRQVIVHPHGVPAQLYQVDRRPAARAAFPEIRDRPVLLSVGRIDPVKNQSWLVEQLPELLRRHPRLVLVLAGPCTDAPYGDALSRRIAQLGLGGNILLTGKLPPGDERLIGLMQEAQAVVLPSISETFGLVILEAWAAGTVVVSSRTSGASALIEHGKNGWLFDLDDPVAFQEALATTLRDPVTRGSVAAAGRKRASADFDTGVLAARMRQLYQRLEEEKHAHRNHS